VALSWLALVPVLSAQIVVTNISVADAFVRSLDPTHNYGGAGALSVSGAIATYVIGQQQGLLDSFMQFDMSNAVSIFNNNFGVGRWTIVRATLNLFEQGAPNNTVFNRGVGLFEVRWLANNSWIEGTGTPNAPTNNGIVWNDRPSLLNSKLDESLGTYVNGGTDGVVRTTLTNSVRFMKDLTSGGSVSIYFTAPTSSPVGFTFHSHNFVDSNQWPFVELTAVPVPRITSLAVVGSDARISFDTGTNLPYVVEYKNDLASGDWESLTNLTSAGGLLTVIDPGAAALSRRFYRIRLVISP